MEVTAVILAAGTSSRMGAQKLLMPVRGVAMIDRVLDACRDYETILVSSPQLAPRIAARPRLRVIENAKPELGMAHSFDLANGAIEPESALLVFLGDKPLVTTELARTIVQAALEGHADICFPERDGVGGHPVFFSPHARSRVEVLSGDSLKTLRDDPQLVRKALPIDDEAAFRDVDVPSDLSALNYKETGV